MSARLKVINETGWSTTDLSRFLRAGLAFLGARPDKVVTCVYRRANSRTLGRARIGVLGLVEQRSITLYLPRPEAAGPSWSADTIRLYAKVLAHEVDHNLGLRHDSMGGCNVHLIDDARTIWIESLAVGLKPVKAAPDKADRIEAKVEKVRLMLATWRRKAKMADTKIKKYRRALLRYERNMAAAKQEPVS